MNIEDLLHNIGISVQNAHAAIEEHTARQFFEHYFEKTSGNGNNDNFTPKMVKIELPPCNGLEGKTFYTPLAALVSHTSLQMDNVKIKLNLKVLNDSNDTFEVNASSADSATQNNQAGELEITYKCTSGPEGISRIDTQLNSML